MTHFAGHPNIIQEEFFHDDIGCERYDGEIPAINYWLGPDEANLEDYFIVDLGGCLEISKVFLRNSFNIWGER